MDKPRSIGRFERYWWGSLGLWAVGRLLAWDRVQSGVASEVARRSRSSETTELVTAGAQWFVIGLTVLVTLLVWWLVARRASAIGKWLAVGLAVWSGVQLLLLLGQLALGGANLHPLSQGALALAAVLGIASAVVLFRDDARAWFGEFDDIDDSDDEGREPVA